MKKPLKIVIIESVFELRKFRRKQTSLSKQKRVDCLLYIKTSKFRTRQELATHLGVHIRTQERWLVRYNLYGLESLLLDSSKVRKSKIITPEIHQSLETRVNSSENPFLGYWDAVQWVNQQHNVKIKYHWLRQYLIKHFKTKLKSPRKSHYKKDQEAVNAFLKTP